ncbi:fimbrial protein [Citrobacter freundii]|nr:fimbrial protein [Citrobacter freundii]
MSNIFTTYPRFVSRYAWLFILLFSGLFSAISQATSLNLPALPTTCSFTQNEITPFDGSWQVDAFAAPGTSISGAPADVLKLGIKCSSLSADLSLAVKADNSGQWLGGATLQETGISGVGLQANVVALPGSDNVTCSGNDIAGSGTRCLMKASTNETSVTLTLNAKLEKTEGATPAFYSGMLPRNLGYVVVLGETEVPVYDWVHPAISTIANCRLSGSSVKSIDFGLVSLAGAKNKSGFKQLAVSDPVTLAVECLPRSDNNQSINTKITFSGTSGSNGDFLITNREDVEIALFSSDEDASNNDKIIEIGKSYKMNYSGKPNDSYMTYEHTVRAALMYDKSRDVTGSGPFTATATWQVSFE